MSETGCQCHVKITVKRYDGEATLSKWIEYPRAPVKGDLIVTCEEAELADRVKVVTLLPIDNEYAPTAWVQVEDDENFDLHWDDDPDWNCHCREKLRSGMQCYLDAGFNLDYLATCWYAPSDMWVSPKTLVSIDPMCGL